MHLQPHNYEGEVAKRLGASGGNGKEGKTVNQKVALFHAPPGLLIDRNDNGPKMHHYL